MVALTRQEPQVRQILILMSSFGLGSGNVATEDVLHMLHGMGIETGIDLGKVREAGDFICNALGITSRSNAALALASKKQ